MRQGIELRQDTQARRAHGLAQFRFGHPLRVTANGRLIAGMRRGDQLRVGAEFGGQRAQEGRATVVIETQVGFRQTPGTLPGRDFSADSGCAFVKEFAGPDQFLARKATCTATVGKQRAHLAQAPDYNSCRHFFLLGLAAGHEACSAQTRR